MHPSKGHPRSATAITAMALLALFLYAISNSTINVLINEVVNGFALSGARQGLMSSLFNAGTMLALLAAPLLQGRINKIASLLYATALQVASLALCGLSSAFSLFLFSCMLLGVGGGLVDAYSNAILTDVHQENKTRYLGYLHGVFGVGSLLAPLLILQVLRWTHWRGVYFVLAGLLLVGGCVLLLLNRRAQQSIVSHATQETVLRRADLKEYLHNPRNGAVLLAAIFATATQTGILIWVVRYMALRFHAEALGTASISLFWVCATVNRFSITRLPMAPIRLFVLGGALSALLVILGVLCGSAWGMCIAMGLLGLSTGHFMQVLFAECTRGYAGKTTFTTSVLIVVMGLTRTLLPLFTAWISTAVSVTTGMLVPAATALGTALAGAALMRLDQKAHEDA